MRTISILGSGGHALSTYSLIQAIGGFRVLGFFDDTKPIGTHIVDGLTVLESIQNARAFQLNFEFEFALGIGGPWPLNVRHELYKTFSDDGAIFPTLIHPSAVIDLNVQIDVGVQIYPGVIIRINSKIGENCLINSFALVEHGTEIKSGSALSPRSTVCGNVKIGQGTLIGAGATIVQEISIGDQCLVAAGSVVTRDVANHLRVQGIPAKPFLGERK